VDDRNGHDGQTEHLDSWRCKEPRKSVTWLNQRPEQALRDALQLTVPAPLFLNLL
jgi:predicted phosphoadenosine phosphosulfate sulfurtransferase